MTKFTHLLGICFLSILASLVRSQNPEPCESNVLMEFLDGGHRSPDTTKSFERAALCDYLLDETKWYRFTSAVSDQIPETCIVPGHCGTQWPIWLNGTHPTANDPGPQNVRVCASNFAGDCCGVLDDTIDVKFCPGAAGSDHFYVYRLKNVPVCDMAYCAIKRPNVSVADSFPEMTGDPEFTGPIEEIKNSDNCRSGTYTDFRFECRIQYPATLVADEARFNVSLTFNGKTDPNNPDTHVVTNSTALTVVFPSIALKGNVGKSVSCEVNSYWEGQTEGSDVRHSNSSYWVGVRYSSPDYNPATGRVELAADTTTTITMENTVPIGLETCNVLSFNYEHHHKLPSAQCQAYFSDDQPQHNITVRVAPTLGCKSYSSLLEFNPYSKPGDKGIWEDYVPHNITIFVRCSEVPSRFCTVREEPTVYTFDKRIYGTQTLPGDFLVMRSNFSSRLFEVHTRDVGCRTTTRTCACAVAVREGNDILGIRSCEGPVTPIRYLRDPNTPDGKAEITKESDDKYKISMPSGSYVLVTIWRAMTRQIRKPGNYLNLRIHPLRVDAYQTTGLCGNYNLDRTDDGPASGRFCTADCEQYRLQPQDSYINGHHFIPHCVYTGEMATVCRCKEGQPFFNCTTDNTQMPVKIFRTTGTDSCLSDGFERRHRKKRDAEEPEAEDDDVILPDDFPIPPYQNSTEFPQPPTWPTPSGITEQQASDACERAQRSYAAYNICQEYADLESLITLCVLNVQLMDTLTGSTAGVVGDLRENCIFSVESSVNTTSDDSRHQPDVVDELVREVENISCPGEPIACSGHGTCNQGLCTCDTGYVGRECSLVADAVPVISKFRHGCTCDVRQRRCSRLFVEADNIHDSGSLTCKIQSANSSTEVYTYAGEMLSETELECPLPSTNDTATSRTWNISVSNDGRTYSNHLQLTVFDSRCLDCQCAGQCQPKSGKCLIDGQCYNADETNPADQTQTCKPAVNSTVWTTVTQAQCDPNCNQSSGCSLRGEGKCDSECVDGYSLNQTAFTCVKCDSKCHQSSGCSVAGTEMCDTMCAAGYRLRRNKCVDRRCFKWLWRRKHLRKCGWGRNKRRRPKRRRNRRKRKQQ